MKRIGRALHVSNSKKIILKAENLPKIGERVVDESQKPVGTVFDIFGPVSSPYIAVKPITGETYDLINHILYVISKPKIRKRRKNYE